MNHRATQKEATRQRILDAASRVLRERGLDGAGVASIMNEAGLTHGGFYVHFDSRRDLVSEVLRHTADTMRGWFFRGLKGRAGLDWVRAAVRRYLAPRHRDHPEAGCIVAGLSGDLAREDDELRGVFEAELEALAGAFREHLEEAATPDADERALALLALCAGGITLSRAVADRDTSNRILRACEALARRDLEEHP